MGFLIVFAIAALIWLSSIAACVISFFAKRLRTSLIFSLIALAIGYLGLTHYQVSASRTVNGHVEWSFNSHWFFVATFVLAVFTLAYAIWKHRKGNHGTTPA